MYIPLIDSGAIEQLKQRMIQAPMPSAAPPPAQMPLMEEPAPIRSVGRGERIQNSLFGQAELPAEYRPFFTPAEQQGLRPGLLNTLTNSLIGGMGRGEVMKNRAMLALAEKDELAKRNDAATLKEQMAALRKRAANGEIDFVEFAKQMTMLNPAFGAPFAGMLNATEPPQVAPPRPTVLSAGQSLVDPTDGSTIASVPLAPVPKEDFSEVPMLGGRALYKNGVFQKWIVTPPSERAPGPIKAPTEAQEKAARFYGLMLNAMPKLRELGPKIRVQTMTAIRKDPTKVATMALTPDERRWWRAAREYATAVLRPETGAAIQPWEVVDVIDRYIDSGFDDPATRADKAEARENYLAIAERSARPAMRYYEGYDPNATPAAQGGAPKGAKKKLSPSDLAKAKTDPDFAAWARANGYEVP